MNGNNAAQPGRDGHGEVQARPGSPVVYLTPVEAGELLRVHPKTVLRLARFDPSMPCLRLGNGIIRFPQQRLLTWLRMREQGAGRARQSAASESAP